MFADHNNDVANSEHALSYSFNLLSGLWKVKYESGIEVPLPCDVFLTQTTDDIVYLEKPLIDRRPTHHVHFPQIEGSGKKRRRGSKMSKC